MELTLTCSSTDVFSPDLGESVNDVSHNEPVYLRELESAEVRSELKGRQHSFDVRRSLANGDFLEHHDRPLREGSKQFMTETNNVLDSDHVVCTLSVKPKCVKIGQLLSGSDQSLNGSGDKKTNHKVGQLLSGSDKLLSGSKQSLNGSGDKKTKHLTKYKISVSTKKSKTSFKCTFCSRTFKYNRQLLTHHIQDHQDRLHFACARCKIKFATVANLSDHVSIHLDSRPFKCVKCLASFTNQPSLANHQCPSLTAVPALQQRRASDVLGRLPVCKLVLNKIDCKVKQDRLISTNTKIHAKLSADNTPCNGLTRTDIKIHAKSLDNTPRNGLIRTDLKAHANTPRSRSRTRKTLSRASQMQHKSIGPSNLPDQLRACNASNEECLDQSVTCPVEVKVEPVVNVPTYDEDTQLCLLLGDLREDKHFKQEIRPESENIISWSPLPQSAINECDVADDTMDWSPARQSAADSGDDTTDWFQDSNISNKITKKKCSENGTNKTRIRKRVRKSRSKTKSLDVMTDDRNESYSCTQCDKRFSSNVILRRHVRLKHENVEVKHRGERSYICKRCCERFDTAKELKVHKLTHNDKEGAELLPCTICGKKLTDLALHYRRVHENKRQFNCDECNRWFFSAIELKQHFIRMHTDVRPYLCPRCGERFAVLTDLHHHMATHNAARRMFACTLCDNKYTSHAQLNVHIRIHNDERTFVCTQCDMKFVSSSHMNRHRRRVHEENRYACDECPRTFAYSGELRSHKLIHAPTRSYACTQCDKTFKLSSYLRQHIRSWHSENRRALMCPVCGKTFTAKGSLVIHAQIHTGMRRHKCPMCDKKFTKGYDVKVHVRQVHTNDRPYPCSQCGRRFASKGNMKNHELIHAGKELYGCPQCDEKFVFHTSLTKHVEESHSHHVPGVKLEWLGVVRS